MSSRRPDPALSPKLACTVFMSCHCHGHDSDGDRLILQAQTELSRLVRVPRITMQHPPHRENGGELKNLSFPFLIFPSPFLFISFLKPTHSKFH